MDEVLPIAAYETLVRQYGWLIAAIALFAFVMFNFSRRRRPAVSSQRQRGREAAPATNGSAAVQQEMERLLGDLHELSRQINSTIEGKFSKLEQTIAEADKRISILRILLQNAKDGASTAGAVRNSPTKWTGERSPSRVSPALNILIGDDGVEDAGEKIGTTGTSPFAEGDSHRQIYELSDRGRSVMEIARETRKSPGEVELILKLRRRS